MKSILMLMPVDPSLLFCLTQKRPTILRCRFLNPRRWQSFQRMKGLNLTAPGPPMLCKKSYTPCSPSFFPGSIIILSFHSLHLPAFRHSRPPGCSVPRIEQRLRWLATLQVYLGRTSIAIQGLGVEVSGLAEKKLQFILVCAFVLLPHISHLQIQIQTATRTEIPLAVLYAWSTGNIIMEVPSKCVTSSSLSSAIASTSGSRKRKAPQSQSSKSASSNDSDSDSSGIVLLKEPLLKRPATRCNIDFFLLFLSLFIFCSSVLSMIPG